MYMMLEQKYVVDCYKTFHSQSACYQQGSTNQKHNYFGTFWRFAGWIKAKLDLIYLKRHLQHDSMPFFSLVSCSMTFLPRHAQKSKFGEFLDEKVTYIFSGFLNFFFAFPFSPFLVSFAVIDLLLGLLPVQKLHRKHHRDGQFLPRSGHE